MDYEIISFDLPQNKSSEEIVFLTREDGSFESFPVDVENPRYVQFQEQLAAEQPTPKAGK